MKKNSILLLLAILCFAGKSHAQKIQPCGTDEMAKKYKQQHPEIAIYEKQLEEDISRYISSNGTIRRGGKTTAAHADTDYYDIPIVMHIMHNYGLEIIPDNNIYQLVAEMNSFYSLKNDTTGVVSEFKKYVGKAKFRFHLATIDPNGNPTKGITHHFTYLCAGGDDQAKMDQWDPANYVNIWFEQRIGALVPGGIIVAYATQPPSAAAYPFSDGIICNYQFVNDGVTVIDPTGAGHSGGSIDHEMGHIFNLFHTFGNTNTPHTNTSGNCTLDDLVDDTPPTEGNLGGCNLFDTVCAFNYYKIYPTVRTPVSDSLVNYPDTSNEQNIMNYADCKYMFTKGQVERMRAALNSDVGNRDNLWDSTNLVNTGALLPYPDLPPVTDFSTKIGSALTWFTCPNTPIIFTNHCWGDTITSITWTFQNGANIPSVTYPAAGINTNVTNTFSEPGWVNFTIAATGNAGSAPGATTTTNYTRSVFVADSVGTPATSYFEEFNNADTAKWPMFNYYNNEFKWQAANVGMYDNNSVEYLGYDTRLNPLLGIIPVTGSPLGDYDDMFSMPADLSSFSGSGPCYLNYNYSGASRSSNSVDINDTMQIDYSIDHGKNWVTLAYLSKEKLDNKGSLSTPYTPSSPADWAYMGLSIPAAARTNYVVFRFRYRPGVSLSSDGIYDITDGSLYSSGNNFYIDRINFNQWPASVANVNMGSTDVAVAPNPTTGDAFVIIKDAGNTTAKVIVSDITGKIVYTASQQIIGNEAHIQIPHAVISVQGMYIVQAITGTQVTTRKLVVE